MKVKQTLALAATTLGLAAISYPATAANFNLSFDFLDGDSSSSSGTGTVTINDSLLVPNQSIGFPGNVNGIQAFSATFTGLAATPSTTTFSLSDLTDWVLETNSNGDITDLNFDSRENSDGYSLSSIFFFTIELGGNGQSTAYNTQVSQVPTQAVPEPSTILGLAAIGIGFGVSFKHKLAKANNKSDLAQS